MPHFLFTLLEQCCSVAVEYSFELDVDAEAGFAVVVVAVVVFTINNGDDMDDG